jgi:hypothetical protein
MLRTLLLGLSIAVSGIGCAASPDTRSEFDAQPRAHTHCLQSTGTHIALKQGRCSILPGRSYSRADIRRTGAMSTAGALQSLDPSIRVGP